MSKNDLHFDTLALHAGLNPEQWEGSTLPPVHQSAGHAFDTAKGISEAFAGNGEHVYMRLSNPTNRALEERLNALEGTAGCFVTASGMGAVSCALLALTRAGDEIASAGSLFLSTSGLMRNILPRYGVTTRFFPATDMDALAGAITGKTRLVFLETIGNPAIDVPDLARAARIAHEHGLPLVVDNTVASPWLCRPAGLGADIIVHSTTKYLSGHGAALGGAVLDAGRFDWTGSGRFPDFAPFVDKKGDLAFLHKAHSEMLVNLGASQAPWHSWLTCLGLTTLPLRMERHQKNAMEVAAYLADHPKVAWVRHPSLPGHPDHATALSQFGGRGFGAMLSFGLTDAGACARFIDGLRLACNLANIGDAKTLVLHPRSTQYVNASDEQCAEMGIAPELIRLSVGIEHAADIIGDLDRALAGA